VLHTKIQNLPTPVKLKTSNNNSMSEGEQKIGKNCFGLHKIDPASKEIEVCTVHFRSWKWK
jgi:hypothetical protein